MCAYYTKLEFNSALFETDSQIKLEELHVKAVEKTIQDIQSMGLGEVWKDPYVVPMSNVMSAIATDNINAFISIYGSGSKMDTSSPYYNSYISGDVYNKARSSVGNKVLFRSKEPYTDYDWENNSRNTVERTGSGRSGVMKNFKETTPNQQLMQDVLNTYEKNFKQLFDEEFVPWATEQINNDLTYWTTTKVEV